MRRHLEQAIALATGEGKASARCEALARLAIEAARLGAASGSEELLQLAERSAADANELVALLPGHPMWGPQANAALTTVALARGDLPAALAAAGAAMQAIQDSHQEDASLEVILPMARAVFAGGPPEVQQFATTYLRMLLARIAQGTIDESMRVRWLRSPFGRELVELVNSAGEAGTADVSGTASDAPGGTDAVDGPKMDDVDRRLLRLLTEGLTNAEMAAKVDLTEADVGVRLAKLLARLGVSNRAEATSLAFKGFSR
jgi:DNA-binding NarL/FixJ family response regulator